MQSFIQLSCRAKRSLSLNHPRKDAKINLPPLLKNIRQKSQTSDKTSTVNTLTFSPKIKSQSPKIKPFSFKQNIPTMKLSCREDKTEAIQKIHQKTRMKSSDMVKQQFDISNILYLCGFENADIEIEEFTLEQYLKRE